MGYQDVKHSAGHLRSVHLAACTFDLYEVGRGSERGENEVVEENEAKLNYPLPESMHTQREKM